MRKSASSARRINFSSIISSQRADSNFAHQLPLPTTSIWSWYPLRSSKFPTRSFDFLPKLTRSDLLSFCESDHYLSRNDKRTTENRVEMVHAGASLTLRICVEKALRNWISPHILPLLYDRVAELQKNMLYVCLRFLLIVIRDNTHLLCDCIRGFSTSCAHRGRVLCELAGQIGNEQEKRLSMSFKDNVFRTSEKNLLFRVSLRPDHKKEMHHQESEPKQDSTDRKSKQLQQLRVWTLLTYLPEGTSDFTPGKVVLIRKKLQEIAKNCGRTDILWPRLGKVEKSELVGF